MSAEIGSSPHHTTVTKVDVDWLFQMLLHLLSNMVDTLVRKFPSGTWTKHFVMSVWTPEWLLRWQFRVEQLEMTVIRRRVSSRAPTLHPLYPSHSTLVPSGWESPLSACDFPADNVGFWNDSGCFKWCLVISLAHYVIHFAIQANSSWRTIHLNSVS